VPDHGSLGYVPQTPRCYRAAQKTEGEYTMNGPITGRIRPGEGPLTSQLFGGCPDPRPAIVPMPQGFDSGGGLGSGTAETSLGFSADQIRNVIAQIGEGPLPEEARQLLSQLTDLDERLQAYIGEMRKRKSIDLRAELKQVRADGRAALEEFRAKRNALGAARSAFNAFTDRYNRALSALQQVENETPDPNEWPTDEELERHAERLEKARAKIAGAEEERAELIRALELATAESLVVRRKLDLLRAKRDALQTQLAGKRPKGPFGLVGLASEAEGIVHRIL
jgi:hypothetical protein